MDIRSAVGNRIKAFRDKLADNNLEGALITKRENYIYLSGFTGTSAFLLITKDHAVLLTDFRYAEQAAEQAQLYEVVQYQGSLLAAINEQLKRLGISKLGFEDSYITYDRYNEYAAKLDMKELVPMEGMIEGLRLRKDPYELEIIREAVRIADDTFSHILGYLKPGITEIEIAAEMEYHMKKLGATGASFETIVASGKRSSLPHGVASEKKLELGDTITLDYGAYYNHYCSDMTRTVFLGTPSDEMKNIYKIVLDAQVKASEGAVAGLLGKEIDHIARETISQNGFEKNFGHGLGHGVGLEIHEDPRLSPAGNIKMENGMTVTVEPGIYVSGLGGVRIEDIIVINDNKPMALTRSTKEMIVL